MPWETGLKDTVLTLPGERVEVAVRFVYPGTFLLHCHNLEHEDMGMMINYEVTE
jgi:FtsP/CotA-like multicopper oxidase with cupredoxin domain